MKRRDFLAVSAGLGAFALTGDLSAQSASGRAAVVIGIDKVGGLPNLNAASGAMAVADWLRAELYDVKLLTDASGPVTVDAVLQAVSSFVEQDNVTMLVVYFAGHGFLANTNTEWWILSDAQKNSNAAIGLLENIGAAKMCGIPNVVFISDACRSLASSLGVGNMVSSKIFPPRAGISGNTDVDRFLATSIGGTAYELSVNESVAQGYQGIFTASLLDAFKHPEQPMILELEDKTFVVPNRELKSFLKKDVSSRAQKKSIKLKQIPDIEVNSENKIYMGHVVGETRAQLKSPVVPMESVIDLALKGAASTFSNNSLAADKLSKAGVTIADVLQYSSEIGFPSGTAIVQDARRPEAFEATGLYFEYAEPVTAFVMGDGKTVVRTDGYVSVNLPERTRGALVVVAFSDGSGCVLPVIGGYVGAVATTEDGGIVNVSYVPTTNSPVWKSYQEVEPLIRRRQSVFSTAATYGGLVIEGDRAQRKQKATQMFADCQFDGIFDPTLAIYSAYAFWHADALEALLSTTKAVNAQLGVPLFDLELLSGSKISPTAKPFFPMLSQGWELVKIYGAETNAIRQLRPHLLQTTWTMFSKEGMELLTPMAQRNNGDIP